MKSDDDLLKVLTGSEPMYQVDWLERLEELDIFGCHVDESGCPSWYAYEAYGFLKLVPLMDADRDILPIGEPITGFIGTVVDLGNVNRGTGETVFMCVVGKGGWLTMIEPADKEC
jgi:hypothetical protein